MSKEKETTNEKAPMTIFEKITEISNLIRIGKEGKNEYKIFEYFTPDQIAISLNPLLQKFKTTLLFHMQPQGEKFLCNLQLRDYENNTGYTEKMVFSKASVQGAGDIQNEGATMTYAKRYMTMNMFNIADSKADPDKSKVAEKKESNEEGRKKAIDILSSSKTKEELEKNWKGLKIEQRALKELFDLKDFLKKGFEADKPNEKDENF
jgi:hypothetical protein